MNNYKSGCGAYYDSIVLKKEKCLPGRVKDGYYYLCGSNYNVIFMNVMLRG